MNVATAKKIDLAQIMLKHLKINFTLEQTFSAPVLYPIATRHGQSPKSSANNMLRKLIVEGYIMRTGYVIPNKNGGSDMPLYKLTGKTTNADIPNKVAAHYDDAAAKYQKLNERQLNLQGILNNFVHNGGAHRRVQSHSGDGTAS